jgi:hypothetical protein
VFPSVWRIGDPVLRAMEARRLICATSVIGEAMAILGGLPPCDGEPIGMGGELDRLLHVQKRFLVPRSLKRRQCKISGTAERCRV